MIVIIDSHGTLMDLFFTKFALLYCFSKVNALSTVG